MRSVIAVVTGYVVITLSLFALFAVWFVDAPVGEVNPSWTFIAVAVVWGFFSAMLGGYLTGKVARRRPFEHAAGLALLSGLIGVASMVASFGEEPVGFQLANLVILMAGCLAGGFLRVARVGRR